MQWGVVNFFSPDVLQFAHEIHPEATVLPAYSMTEVAPGVESRVGWFREFPLLEAVPALGCFGFLDGTIFSRCEKIW